MLWIKICEGPTRFCMDQIMNLKSLCDSRRADYHEGFFFTDIREPDEIKKLVNAVKALEILGIDCKTVIVERPDTFKVWNNSSDDSVRDYDYDLIVSNDSSLGRLQEKARDYMKKILGGN